MRSKRTGNRVAKFFGIVYALKNSLRALREAFAFFIKLTQNIQPRSLLGERPLKGGKTLFRFGKQLSFFLQANLDIDRFASVCFQRGGNLPEEFIAPTARCLTFFRKLFDLCA